jgi:hypothetical protein
MTFAEAIVGLLADLRLRGYSPKTLDSYADQLKPIFYTTAQELLLCRPLTSAESV